MSTGQIFRDAISSGSELGKKVKSIIDSGFLVPDSLTNEIVKDMLGKIDLLCNKFKILCIGRIFF